MTTYNNNLPQRSVYSLGASDGLWIGLAMSACFLAMIGTSSMPLLGPVGLVLFLGTPYLAWRLLRRGWVYGMVPGTFSAVWLHGICTFLFGSIILALVMYLTLNFAAPNWLVNQTMQAAQRMAELGQEERALQIYAIIDNGLLPSPINMAFSSIWLVAFTGSLWSMLFAAILTCTPSFKKSRAKNLTNNGTDNE